MLQSLFMPLSVSICIIYSFTFLSRVVCTKVLDLGSLSLIDAS